MTQNELNIGDISAGDIDDIKIMADHDPRRVAIRIGLTCTLYVSNPHDEEVRKRLAVCGDDYLARFGSMIRLHQDSSGKGRFKSYSQSNFSLSSLVENNKYDPRSPFTPSFTGSDNADDASSYSLKISAPGTRYFEPGEVSGSFSITLPVFDFLNRKTGRTTAAFQDLVHNWCNQLQPRSGHAGLGLVQSIDWDEMRRTVPQVAVLAKRFPGLEVENPEVVGNHIGDNIKGINWLTVIADELLEKIGGRNAVSSRLDGEMFPLRDYGGGIIIQAGPSPQIGDLNRQNLLTPYQEVSGLLRPLRMEFPDGHSLINTGFGTGTEMTNSWLERFD